MLVTHGNAGVHTVYVYGFVGLLTERPDAIGLALPGMPVDSPGMGGDADDWADQPVVLIHTDGSLSDWDW